jgi:hypothetical protein
MESQLLILKNKSQSFIEAKDKRLSCFTTSKGRTMLFLQAEQCGVVFLGENLHVFLVPSEPEFWLKVKYKC